MPSTSDSSTLEIIFNQTEHVDSAAATSRPEQLEIHSLVSFCGRWPTLLDIMISTLHLCRAQCEDFFFFIACSVNLA